MQVEKRVCAVLIRAVLCTYRVQLLCVQCRSMQVVAFATNNTSVCYNVYFSRIKAE